MNNKFYEKQLEKRSSKKWYNLKKANETSTNETGLASSFGKPNIRDSQKMHKPTTLLLMRNLNRLKRNVRLGH